MFQTKYKNALSGDKAQGSTTRESHYFCGFFEGRFKRPSKSRGKNKNMLLLENCGTGVTGAIFTPSEAGEEKKNEFTYIIRKRGCPAYILILSKDKTAIPKGD